MKNGHGQLTYPNKCIYEGKFLNDEKHGEGILTYPGGEVTEGTWQNGNLIS